MTHRHPARGSVRDLVRSLSVECNYVCTNRGGFGYRIRHYQELMRQARNALRKWGRPMADRGQADIFDERAP